LCQCVVLGRWGPVPGDGTTGIVTTLEEAMGVVGYRSLITHPSRIRCGYDHWHD
jgi:hypothetical protein